MTELRSQIDDALVMIRRHTDARPEVGIVLGTGLGQLVDEIDVQTVLEYGDIPHFPLSTVESHHGRLVFGALGGKAIVAMQGRFHFYEGYSLQQVTFPVRVMHALGAHTLMTSNAVGGMNPHFRRGDIMVIEDHINLLGDNPLIGPNDDTLGPRFPDMSEPYSHRLIALAEEIALEHRLQLRKGVLVAVSGPSLETRAEYRFLRAIGADAVGMSTIPEVIVGVHMGMHVLGFSIVTDECFPDALAPVNLHEMLSAANAAEPKLRAIMKGVITRLGTY